MQGLKRLDREEIGDINTADLRDASYVVAHQVDNHQILSALLHIGAELKACIGIGLRCASARRRSLHRTR